MKELIDKIEKYNKMPKIIFNKKVTKTPLTEEEKVFDEKYLSKMWNMVELSKLNCDFNSDKQYNNLVSELKKIKFSDVVEIKNFWRHIHAVIINNENFISLSNELDIHGDDSTFMDFGNWIVSQGEELCLNFVANGTKAVIDYINKNNIAHSDYTYECMIYAFSKALDD